MYQESRILWLMPCHVIICLSFSVWYHRHLESISNTRRTGQHSGYSQTLDTRNMDQLVQHYLRCSLAPSTKQTYVAGQCRYLDSCTKVALSPFPADEKKLWSFVATLGHEGLKAQTIKKYLSAICNRQIMLQLGNPFQVGMPVLEYVLRGIKMDQAKHHPSKTKQCLPITPVILWRLREVWGSKATDPPTLRLAALPFWISLIGWNHHTIT